jgi:hypothetical protein
VLRVKRKGEELIDPETGLNLGSSDVELGTVRVTQTEEKFSIASVESLNGPAARGDMVESTAPPPSIEYASAWSDPRRGQF